MSRDAAVFASSSAMMRISMKRHKKNLRIRQATADDAETIADFNSRLALETEGRTLDPDLINAGAAAVLTDPGKGQYWLAEVDGIIVGQLMVTYEWSDWRNGQLWWLQSVYIHEDFRRQGVFSDLYRHVESLARQSPGVCGLRLYVENDNKRAQETYFKLGMVLPGYQVMEVDFHKDAN
jgi:ribosomal protein S18 acetylase RimI-like enzyme